MAKIGKIIVHWTAGPSTQTVEDIRQIHVNGNGWRTIGYHRIVLHPDGYKRQEKKDPSDPMDLIKCGRDLDDDQYIEPLEIGAHALNHNSYTVGWVVVAGPKHPPHPWQLEALVSGLKIHIARFGLSRLDVIGHRDVNATECPGNQIYALIKDFQAGKYEDKAPRLEPKERVIVPAFGSDVRILKAFEDVKAQLNEIEGLLKGA